MNFLKNLILLFFLSGVIVSCNIEPEQKPFYYTEKELIELNEPGLFLEYAMFDSANIDFVRHHICDTLQHFENMYFGSSWLVDFNNDTHYVLGAKERYEVCLSYSGVFYLNPKRPEIFSRYNFDWVYPIDSFHRAISDVIESENVTLDELLKYDKVGDSYISKILFVLCVDSYSCDSGFIETVISSCNIIDSVWCDYVKTIHPDLIDSVKPIIHIEEWVITDSMYIPDEQDTEAELESESYL